MKINPSAWSLRQKAGQTLFISFKDTQVSDPLKNAINQLCIGGIVLFEHNVESPRQLRQLTDDLQAAAQAAGLPPLFIGIDQEGGRVTRLRAAKGFTEFPSAQAVAATGDVQVSIRNAQIQAAELHAAGININFAPDLDVNNNPANPVIGARSYSSNPVIASQFGVAYGTALQQAGIMAVGKHFPGHGDTSTDSHFALPHIPHARARLDAIELVPFRAAIAAGISGIMSAHILFDAIDPARPATLSRNVLHDLLRGELGFSGLVFTDSIEMKALTAAGFPPKVAAAEAVAAGADVVLSNTTFEIASEMHAEIVRRVEHGELPIARLDDAITRILAMKAIYIRTNQN
ncbi:MAG: beta-N-acetylhexosaminidase [Anaerolineae bacterium]|nr:beta-N-acetylhexosaminidase [Anaerolineae bacterium]